jgi:2-amino-4-hydroxy-6-hydroxymethyldihydropteridine diphosphokinase
MCVAPEDATPERRAFIGLGSNLGDRHAELARAVAGLRAHGDVAAVSPLFETDPVGGPEGQPAYLNVVVELCTSDSPRELLDRCRVLEETAGRIRTVKFGPRTLDADVLLVGDERVDEPDLTVPHPRMWGRRFVLAPLRELAAELIPPGALDRAEGGVRRIGTL